MFIFHIHMVYPYESSFIHALYPSYPFLLSVHILPDPCCLSFISVWFIHLHPFISCCEVDQGLACLPAPGPAQAKRQQSCVYFATPRRGSQTGGWLLPRPAPAPAVPGPRRQAPVPVPAPAMMARRRPATAHADTGRGGRRAAAITATPFACRCAAGRDCRGGLRPRRRSRRRRRRHPDVEARRRRGRRPPLPPQRQR
jgi:hypothetical protein